MNAIVITSLHLASLSKIYLEVDELVFIEATYLIKRFSGFESFLLES